MAKERKDNVMAGLKAKVYAIFQGQKFFSGRFPVRSLKLDNDVKIGLVKVALMLVLPFVLIWSVRTLFQIEMPITFKNWFAAFLLVISMRLIFKDFDRSMAHSPLWDRAASVSRRVRQDKGAGPPSAETEEVVELKETLQTGEGAEPRRESREFLDQMDLYRFFVTRKELVQELSKVVIALSEQARDRYEEYDEEEDSHDGE